MLKEAALDIKPAAVMVDTVADVYGGSEIDRGPDERSSSS